MTFGELMLLTQNRMSDSTGDEESVAVIKSAINQSYMIDICTVAPVLVSAIVPTINGLVTLPSDCINIVSLSPSLIDGEKRVGNYIVTKRAVTFTVIYSAVPTPLVDDTDVIDLSDRYTYMMSTYGVYAYYTYRKKEAAASMFLNEYETLLSKIKFETTEDITEEFVSDYYTVEVDS